MRGDPPARMFATVKELLWRQRQIEVFPFDQQEVLLSLYPEAMQDVTLNSDERIEWMNVDACLTRDTAVLTEIKGEAGHAFWMKFPTKVVAPIGGVSLTLPEENFHYNDIESWWKNATKIHRELQEYQDALWQFFSRADHPLLVKKYWTELHPFVDFELLPSHEEPNLTKRRVVPMPDEAIREGVITTLAASTLLTPYKCTAWVDYEADK